MAATQQFSGKEVLWMIRGLAFTLGGFLCCILSLALTQLLPLMVWVGWPLLGLPVGAAILWFGQANLCRISTPGAVWQQITSSCLGWATALVFLSPFVYLWNRSPEEDYFTANLCAAFAVGLALIMQMTRQVRSLAEFFEDEALVAMSRVFQTINYAVLLFPSCVLFSGFVGTCMVRHLPIFDTLSHNLLFLAAWPKAVALAPPCLTAALLWTAKAVALAEVERLTNTSHPAAP